MSHLDNEGYPTEEYLKWIADWSTYNNKEHTRQILKSLQETWNWPQWGIKIRRPYKKKIKIELHTGGWSGNEEIIAALKQNTWFWHHWTMTKTGGHYYFEFKTEEIR